MHRTQNSSVSVADTDGLAPVTPADILRGAARYLEIHGWTQNLYYGGTSADVFPPACADGAIGMAAYGYCSLVPHSNHDDPAYRDFNRARTFLAGYLKRLGCQPPCDPWCDQDFTCCCTNDGTDITFGWNDYDGQTVGNVIATLRAAADEYDWTHATDEQLKAFAEYAVGCEPRPVRELFVAWLGAR